MNSGSTIAGAALAWALCAAALSAGCPPADGQEVAKVEGLNQLILDQDFLGFAKAIEAETGVNIRGGITSVATQYEAGFDGCTTVVQRVDVGGMVQSVIMYHGKIGPLFGYFRTVAVGTETKILSFSLNGSIDEIMTKLH